MSGRLGRSVLGQACPTFDVVQAALEKFGLQVSNMKFSA
jgi:hypothetical protein